MFYSTMVEQQVTIVPYCVINNCTIENCELLDTIYTDSRLVIITKDNQTEVVTNKNEEQLQCQSTVNRDTRFIVLLVPLTTMALVSKYIIVIHMLVKDLCTAFRFMLMLYTAQLQSCNYHVSSNELENSF